MFREDSAAGSRLDMSGPFGRRRLAGRGWGRGLAERGVGQVDGGQIVSTELVGGVSLDEHENPVAELGELVVVGGAHEHCDALGGGLADEPVDRCARADIDSQDELET
jgi:hypothetical protein